MFFTRNLPISRCGIETGVAQVLLKQAQCVAGVVELHCVNAEGIP
jgi:hypothetical protein